MSRQRLYRSTEAKQRSYLLALKKDTDMVYADCLKDYYGEILLVGINYNKDDKWNICEIKKLLKKLIE